MIAIRKSPEGRPSRPEYLLVAALAVLLPHTIIADEFPTDQADGDIFFDIGSMNAKPSLGFGWSNAESSGSRNYRWITHHEGDVHFELQGVRDIELWVESQPLFLIYMRQVVAVYINNRFAGEWMCVPAHEFEVTRLEIPARFLREGANTLTFRSAYRAQVGTEKRELSLCVDRILLRLH